MEPTRAPHRVSARRSPPDLLLLGSGGPVGLAWQLGWLAHATDLLKTGVPVIGTSAGAMAGALLLLQPERRQAVTAALRAAAQQATVGSPAESTAAQATAPADPDLQQAAAASYGGDHTAVSALGRLMAARPDDGSHLEQVRQMVGEQWPAGDLTVVAREVSTGERKLFRGEVPLYLAVAGSSAAAGRTGPVTIGGQQYIDGSTDRSSTQTSPAVLTPCGFWRQQGWEPSLRNPSPSACARKSPHCEGLEPTSKCSPRTAPSPISVRSPKPAGPLTTADKWPGPGSTNPRRPSTTQATVCFSAFCQS